MLIRFKLPDFIEPAKATGSAISPLSGFSFVRSFVSNELILKTAPTIFLKLGMKFRNNQGKNSTARFFIKILSNHLGLSEIMTNKFSKFPLKVSSKIVLQDKIVILIEKI